MSDTLDDALMAAGVPPETATVVREYLRSRDAYVTIDYQRQWKRKAQREKDEAVAAASAMPEYHGAITRCQAHVVKESGRMTIFGRCARKPVRVRRVKEDHGRYRGDGRLAVCGQHAKSVSSPSRWVKTDHWMDRGKPPTADEIVEPEYQP